MYRYPILPASVEKAVTGGSVLKQCFAYKSAGLQPEFLSFNIFISNLPDAIERVNENCRV